jgi:hypothetical protein
LSAVEALEEAETEIRARSASPVRMGTSIQSMSLQKVIATPVSIPENSQEQQEGHRQGTEWTKAHWKMLDTSFTDERLAVGEAMGREGQMASVDDVSLDAIVERFLKENEDGATWDQYVHTKHFIVCCWLMFKF